jgi:salicylate hydroxylase
VRGRKAKDRIQELTMCTVEDTGQAAYRILVHREQVLDDPELLALIDGKTSYRWIGEGRHIIVSIQPL